MFCDQCGAQLHAGEPRCGRCGKTVLGLIELRRSRVREHVRLVGILWIAYSALHVVVGIAAILVANLLFGHSMHLHGLLRPLIEFAGLVILAKASAGFIAGWGLLQREDWARTLALVVGFIALLNVPVGTALGIYTLWVLLPKQADDEYRALTQAA
jgi:hypothetical protein